MVPGWLIDFAGLSLASFALNRSQVRLREGRGYGGHISVKARGIWCQTFVCLEDLLIHINIAEHSVQRAMFGINFLKPD